MATDKKKEVKMKDLKPAKDAKGGAARQQTNSQRGANRGTTRTDGNRGSTNSSSRLLS